MANLNSIRTARVKLTVAHRLFPEGVIEAAGGGGGGGKSRWTVMRDIEAGTFSDEIYHIAGLISADGTLTAAPVFNVIMLVPFYVGSNELTVDRMAFEITAGGAAGSLARVGIYNATSEANMYPSSLVVDAGEKDGTSAIIHISTVSATLSANTLYWFAYVCGVGTPTIRVLNEDSTHVVAYDSSFPTEPHTGIAVGESYGALPDPYPVGGILTSASTRLPVIGVRLA